MASGISRSHTFERLISLAVIASLTLVSVSIGATSMLAARSAESPRNSASLALAVAVSSPQAATQLRPGLRHRDEGKWMVKPSTWCRLGKASIW